MTKTTTTYALPDDARAEMRRVLENEFRSFLAHDPHDPDRFWGLAVDAVMRAAARAETTAAPAWPTAPLVWWEGEVWVRGDDGEYQTAGDYWAKSHLDSTVQPVRAGARRFVREAIPVTIVPTEAWETWKHATRDLDYTPDCELIDAVDSLAQEVAR